MATLTADTFLDDGTARTAGEQWTLDGGKLTVRTDNRWHADAPAGMTGAFAATTVSPTLGGGVLIDGRNVRWMPFDTGTGNVPAIGTTITQGGVSGYLLGVWADLVSAPTAVGAAMPTTGFIKFREVTDGPYAVGALTGIGASATGPDVTGWIEVVQQQSTANTISRKGSGHVTRGDWFYLDKTTGVRGQVLQVPTNGGGVGTYCPGAFIETAENSDEYVFWPELADSNNGWWSPHIGTGIPDKRHRFVKGLGSGQMQIGETVSLPAATYAQVAQTATAYAWSAGVVTFTLISHGYVVGQQVYVEFTSGGATANGVYTIETVPTTGLFTIALAGAGASGAATIYARTIITSTAHGLVAGQTFYLENTSGSLASGEYEAISTSTNKITIWSGANNGTGTADLTVNLGLVPPANCRVRIGNVFLRQCTSAARSENARPSSSIGARPIFTTTGAGAIDHQYTMSDWYYSLTQPYSVTFRHFATYDSVSISECATALDIFDGGVSMNRGLNLLTFSLTSCFAGGTIQDFTFMRGNVPGSNDHAISMSLCIGQTFNNVQSGIIQTGRSSGAAISMSQCDNITLNSHRTMNSAGVLVTTSSGIRINDIDHVDRVNGYTIGYSNYAVTVATKSNDVIVDGITEGYNGEIPRLHPYAGLVSVTASNNITIRNHGTRANPVGSALKAYDIGALYVSGGDNYNVRVQRLYRQSIRSALLTDVNSDKKVLYESLSAPQAATGMTYTLTVAALNAIVRGCTAPLLVTAANASVYGTHWWSMFTWWYRQISTYTWSANILTIAFTGHGLVVGDKVYLKFESGDATASGIYTVKTVSSANAYTVALAGSGTAGSVMAYKHLVTSPSGYKTDSGRLHLPLNESTTETAEYAITTGTAQFTSAPSLTIPNDGDEAVVETQHFIKGHTGFPNIPAIITGALSAQTHAYTWAANVVTVTVTNHGMQVGDKIYLNATTGTLPNGLYTVASVTSADVYTIALTGSGTSGNATAYKPLHLRYKIDTGSGYNADWRNLAHFMISGATTIDSPTITMFDTSSVNVGDYIYGIGVGVDAKVQSIDSATQITATVNSVATEANVFLQFNQLPNETISASTGFKLKVSLKAAAPAKTVVLTYLTIPTVTTVAAQDNLYPLDTVQAALTLSGLKTGSEVRVFRTSDDAELAGVESSGTSFTYNYTWEGTDTNCYIVVHALQWLPIRYENTVLGSNGLTIPIQQTIDRQYINP